MSKNTVTAIYLIALVATVVIMDILFFRHKFWLRLIANIGTVLVYLAFYLAFVR